MTINEEMIDDMKIRALASAYQKVAIKSLQLSLAFITVCIVAGVLSNLYLVILFGSFGVALGKLSWDFSHLHKTCVSQLVAKELTSSSSS